MNATGARQPGRRNRLVRERVHDPYRTRAKPGAALGCPQCGLEYRDGRWSQAKADSKPSDSEVCPACRRINDDYPAGETVISGAFVGEHRDEIMARVRHVEQAENSEHPLNRIMAIDDKDGSIVITTTDIHLPHRIAHALKDAFSGEMETHYDMEGYFTRVTWTRDT